MKLCVMVLAIGDISYAADSKRILTDYFSAHGIEYRFIESIPDIDTRGSHPSWWKLLAHKIIPGYDYIVCWDLDLLPSSRDVSCINDFNTQQLCLAWDSHAKHNPNDLFIPEFKYNGGLIGYPSSAISFMEGIFNKYAPGTYPSYEQYYLNEEIAKQSYPVQELPGDMNVLYSAPEFDTARLQHYTYKDEAKSKIKDHVIRYFQHLKSDDSIMKLCKLYTMISQERMLQNMKSVDIVEKNSIHGDIVEVGVWKGGSMLSMILKYQSYGKETRSFHLYDTFSGMTQPTTYDVDMNGTHADTILHHPGIKAEASIEDVKHNILSNTTYPTNKILFHKGDIMNNTFYPESIAILRLDTDFYDSTKHELDVFYKLVSPGGVVIIDDYGHWKGCRKAVDEFLLQNPTLQLIPIDYTGVYFIKP